jgi:hypothetical protein
MKISRNYTEFQIALNAPICPQLLREDAIVTNENGWYRTITPSSPWAADDNEILFSNMGERDDIDREIERLITDYQQFGRPMRWCVYPWTYPADLGERLIQRGATRSNVQALLCNTALPLELVDGAVITRVDPNSNKDYEAYINIMASGIMSSGRTLPADEVDFRRHRYRELMIEPKATMQLFLARYEGVVAGCGAMYIKEDSAWLTGDFVAPPYQARGLFQSLIAVRLKALRDMGIPIASGHGREETSVPWLKRFGFQPIFPYRIYQIDPPSATK